MRVPIGVCVAAMMMAAGVGSVSVRAGEATLPPGSAGRASLEDFSKASSALYKGIAGSLVRVRIDQGFAGMLTQPQRKEFNQWMKSLATEGAGAQQGGVAAKDEQLAARLDAVAGGHGRPAAARVPVAQLFRKYVEEKIRETKNPEELKRWRLIQKRLQQPIAETTGVAIDAQGDVMVLGYWMKEGPPISIRVITQDGTELSAKYIGSHAARGIAIIRLESPGLVPPLGIASGAPETGELLMCMSANTGAVGWIAVPEAVGRKNGENRFAVFGGGGRGAMLLFNTSGQLAAMGFDRFALPLKSVDKDIQWICENKRDVTPRQLGVRYAPVPPALRRTIRALGNKTAVMVEDVAAGSPAEKAGLKKDDIIISLDQRPIWQLPQIQWDIATETAPVPIGIVRGGKEQTLSMPLD